MSYLVHIGYAKAGSTFLQTSLFSGAHPDVMPLFGELDLAGRYKRNGKTPHEIFFDDNPSDTLKGRQIIPFRFDPDKARARIESGRSRTRPLTVISNEVLAGHPFAGGATAETIARRIRDTLPEAKILIMIREQRAMLLSAYSEYLTRSTGAARLPSYLNPTRGDQIPQHLPQYYCFSPLVRWYSEAFGTENVLVLPLEQLVSDPRDTFRRIESFAGISHHDIEFATGRKHVRNTRHYTALRMATFLNLLGTRTSSNSGGSLGVPGLRDGLMTLTAATIAPIVSNHVMRNDKKLIHEHLADHIAVDNVELQKHVPIDLKELGYLFDNER